MSYQPQIGEARVFHLLSPFSRLAVENAIYTCRSLRSANEMIAMNEALYDTIYKPLAITVENYQSDMADNVTIVGLQAGTGEWIYVPHTYVERAPTIEGVEYVPVVMGISLGPVPNYYSLDVIKSGMTQLVKGILGVTPEIKAVIPGHRVLLSNDTHDRLEAARVAIKAENEEPTVEELKNQIELHQAKIQQLEEYIKSTL